jgi:hypothetical protein
MLGKADREKDKSKHIKRHRQMLTNSHYAVSGGYGVESVAVGKWQRQSNLDKSAPK